MYTVFGWTIVSMLEVRKKNVMLQRNIIIAFTLIVAVACDVSEIVQGDGWSKDASGYHYDVPAEKFFEDAPAEQEVIQEFVPEQAAPGVCLAILPNIQHNNVNIFK